MFSSSPSLSWSPEATEALEQALQQMPGPKFLAGHLRGRLQKAAEDTARAAGHTTVLPEDLMHGLLGMLPASMRTQIEERMKEGPEGLQKLQKDIEENPEQFGK